MKKFFQIAAFAVVGFIAFTAAKDPSFYYLSIRPDVTEVTDAFNQCDVVRDDIIYTGTGALQIRILALKPGNTPVQIPFSQTFEQWKVGKNSSDYHCPLVLFQAE